MACWLPLWPSAHSSGGTLGNLHQTVTLPSSKPSNPRVLTLVGKPYSCGLCSLLQPHFQSLFALVTSSSCTNLHALPQALPGTAKHLPVLGLLHRQPLPQVLASHRCVCRCPTGRARPLPLQSPPAPFAFQPLIPLCSLQCSPCHAAWRFL